MLVLIALAASVDGPALAAQFAVRQQVVPPSLYGQVFTTAAGLKVGSFAMGAALAGPVATGLGSADAIVCAALRRSWRHASGSRSCACRARALAQPSRADWPSGRRASRSCSPASAGRARTRAAAAARLSSSSAAAARAADGAAGAAGRRRRGGPGQVVRRAAWRARGLRRGTASPRTRARAGSGRAACRTAGSRSAPRPRCRPPAITVPSPKGRWKLRPSARAKSSANTPSATRTSASSTNEKGPNVLTISSSAATAATRCSRLRRRKAGHHRRRAASRSGSAIAERPHGLAVLRLHELADAPSGTSGSRATVQRPPRRPPTARGNRSGRPLSSEGCRPRSSSVRMRSWGRRSRPRRARPRGCGARAARRPPPRRRAAVPGRPAASARAATCARARARRRAPRRARTSSSSSTTSGSVSKRQG